MKIRWFVFSLSIVIPLILQACSGTNTAAISEDDQVATSVAGTLAAVTVYPTPTSTLTPISTVTSTPTPGPATLRVVYSRAGSIWIWTEGEQPKQLTNNIVDGKPRISGDGKIVVFERNNELYAINSDGSNLRVLVSNEYLKNFLPSGYKFIWAEFYDWMLNSHVLYFSTKTGISGAMTDIYQYDLHRVNVDSGEISRLFAPGYGGIPYFSPNGNTIAMVQRDAIYLANSDGSELRKALPFDQVYTYSEWIYFPIVVPLPDGSGFRVVIPAHDMLNNPTEPSKLWEIPVTGDPVVIYSYIQSGFPFYALSPNGRAIGYSKVDANEANQTCIYRQDMGQDYCMPQTGNNPGFLFWSPDSTKYVTYSYSDTQDRIDFSIVEVNAIPAPTNTYFWMLWVDARRYLYVSEEGNLYLTSLDGTQIKLDKGISNQNIKTDRWPWQFDFSG